MFTSGGWLILISARSGRMNELESLKILSFGAGAIGTYIGGSLALAGHRVVFLERPEVVGFLQEHGLTLDLAADKKRWKADGSVSSLLHPGNVEFYSDLEAVLSRGPFDFSIFALKSFDMDSAVEQMKPYVGKLPPVVCLSNGVENEAALATVFGRENVLAGTVTSSVGVRKIGHIVLERLRGVGIEEKHPLSLFISREMNRARLNAQLIRGPASLKWSKLLTNLPANATSAILNMSPDEVFSDPRLFKLEMQMLSTGRHARQSDSGGEFTACSSHGICHWDTLAGFHFPVIDEESGWWWARRQDAILPYRLACEPGQVRNNLVEWSGRPLWGTERRPYTCQQDTDRYAPQLGEEGNSFG
jgi:2-dehydropantoate 2-reductase